MAPAALGHEEDELRRGHGDPCGPSPDASLVCCIGLHESTLIRDNEECCNGRATGQGQICCGDVISVPLASPNHDACCLHPGRRNGVTYDSSLSYCYPRTGEVLTLPFVEEPQSSNALHTFPGTSLQSSSSLASLVSSFDEWCEAGEDENRSQGPMWEGEEVLCCGRVSYFASRQTCCRSRLHNVPAREAQCCYDEAFRKGDPSNHCLGRCGPYTDFDSERELCCNGVVHQISSLHDVCCGRSKISARTHICCAEGTLALPRNGPHRCCKETTPYLKRYMRCTRRGGGEGGEGEGEGGGEGRGWLGVAEKERGRVPDFNVLQEIPA